MKYKQTKDELLEHFQEQLSFLKSSIEAFDNGNIGESKRIASALRLLLHDTRNSHSLMKQLVYKDKIKYFDTANNWDEENLVSHFGLVALNIKSDENEKLVRFLPKLEPKKKKLFNFRIWWEKIVIVDTKKNKFSRKDIVLTVADQDGGAHVDPKIHKGYADLTRLGSIGVNYKIDEEGIGLSMQMMEDHIGKQNSDNEGFIPLEDIVAYSIRQIAFEFMESIEQLKKENNK